jgi:hypothetical protein
MNSNVKILETVLLAIVLFINSAAQIQNIRIDGGWVSNPEEVSIAINPLNTDVLVAGSNPWYSYQSRDAGMTWTYKTMNNPVFGSGGDPCIVFDELGNVYYGQLSEKPVNYGLDRIVVRKSTDNGYNWDVGTGIGYNLPKQQDKEWLAVDLTQSPYRGNIYVTWTEFDNYGSLDPNDSSRIRFSRSTDRGETFSDAITISDRCGDAIDDGTTTEGAVPTVGPNGEIYVSWAGPEGIMFDKSLDGGITWGKDVFVSDNYGGWRLFIWGIYRCNGFPVTMCDISNSPYRGNIYICWTDKRNGVYNTDIFLSRSTDGGNTWSSALKVNDDSSDRNQFFPWMTVDPVTGYLWGIFYDKRNTVGMATDVYVVRSTDGGQSFENFQISESSFIPTQNIFFGDYTNIAAFDGKVYPIWMRLHEKELSIWTAPIYDSTSIVGVNNESFQPTFHYLYQNYPNPFNPTTMISYQLANQEYVILKIFDILGNEIETLVNEYKNAGVHEIGFDASNLSSGIYLAKIDAGSFHESKKMLLLK